jgi:hypothetical protein
LLPQLNTNHDDYSLQLDVDPPHSHTNVRVLLNRVLPQRWIGRAANGKTTFSLGHPVRRISHLAIYFLWRLDKDSVHVPPLPTPIQELACTAGNYSGHAGMSLITVWVCVHVL